MEKRKPRAGEFVATQRGPKKIVYAAEGIVELKGGPNSPIPIGNLEPSADGRSNVWVIVPK